MRIRAAHKALKRVTSRGLDGPWKRYTMRGGSGDRRWTTTGIMKEQIGADGRIVLEALQSRANSDIIVRVYREDPLETCYARRVTSPTDVERCTTEAAAIFDTMPGVPLKGLGMLGIVFNLLFRGALNPPPPPFDIDEIEVLSPVAPNEDAEAVASDGQPLPCSISSAGPTAPADAH